MGELKTALNKEQINEKSSTKSYVKPKLSVYFLTKTAINFKQSSSKQVLQTV